MGLLDDAIRQHLELKRRHGADPSDVAKLEHEAFGPIERDDALGVADLPAAPPEDEAGHLVAREEELAYEESELEADEAWQTSHPEPPHRVEPELAEPAPYAAPEPVEPPQPADAAPLDDPGARTVEFSALDAEPDPQPDAAPGEHDELEETPEFLQETPEHDRLWFEQKPPRDFDF